ncbi:glycosyltransferase [Enterococcus sp. LJL99]
MKILQFCSSIGKHSGVMKVLTEYHKYLFNKYDLTFDYMYWCDDEVDYSLEIASWDGKLIKIGKPSLKSYSDFIETLKKFSGEYDIIHVHELYLVNFFYKVVKRNDCKIIGHAHTTEFSDKKIGRIRNKLLCKGVGEVLDYQLASSKKAGELYFGKNFQSKGTVVPNVLETEEYLFNKNIRFDYRRDMKIDDRVVFLHVGRFNNQKNHKKILSVFQEYLKLDDKAFLICVGEGPLKIHYENYVERTGLTKNVVFLNTRKDINKLMMASDIFLFPSLFEGLGIALVEAQYTGLYCVCSDVVPEEAFITNEVLKISLSQSSQFWAEKIFNSFNGKMKFRNRKILELNSNMFDSSYSGDVLLNVYKGVL